MELALRILLSIVVSVIWLVSLHWIWTKQLDPRAAMSRFFEKAVEPPDWVATRDQTKIYQNGRHIGDVTGPVDQKSNQVHFAQLINTTGFDSSKPFEYQRLTLRVTRIGTIIGMKSEVSEKGAHVLNAVMEDVSCTIIK
jgi:hypothetical protein